MCREGRGKEIWGKENENVLLEGVKGNWFNWTESEKKDMNW